MEEVIENLSYPGTEARVKKACAETFLEGGKVAHVRVEDIDLLLSELERYRRVYHRVLAALIAAENKNEQPNP